MDGRRIAACKSTCDRHRVEQIGSTFWNTSAIPTYAGNAGQEIAQMQHTLLLQMGFETIAWDWHSASGTRG